MLEPSGKRENAATSLKCVDLRTHLEKGGKPRYQSIVQWILNIELKKNRTKAKFFFLSYMCPNH